MEETEPRKKTPVLILDFQCMRCKQSLHRHPQLYTGTHLSENGVADVAMEAYFCPECKAAVLVVCERLP